MCTHDKPVWMKSLFCVKDAFRELNKALLEKKSCFQPFFGGEGETLSCKSLGEPFWKTALFQRWSFFSPNMIMNKKQLFPTKESRFSK